METQTEASGYKTEACGYKTEGSGYKTASIGLSLAVHEVKFSPAPGKVFSCIPSLFPREGKGSGYIFRLPNIS